MKNLKSRTSHRRKIIRPVRRGVCSFCQAKTEPDFKDVNGLRQLITERGRIVGRGRTGLCQKHQRRAAVAIKRARHLALLSFVVKPQFK